jgi:hypothetical protein
VFHYKRLHFYTSLFSNMFTLAPGA